MKKKINFKSLQTKTGTYTDRNVCMKLALYAKMKFYLPIDTARL